MTKPKKKNLFCRLGLHSYTVWLTGGPFVQREIKHPSGVTEVYTFIQRLCRYCEKQDLWAKNVSVKL